MPRKLKRELANHEVETVLYGWSDIKNGDLLKLAEAELDVVLTVDQNLSFQQNLNNLDIENRPHGGSKQSTENTFATNPRGASSDRLEAGEIVRIGGG